MNGIKERARNRDARWDGVKASVCRAIAGDCDTGADTQGKRGEP
jgi:hypothetical protein